MCICSTYLFILKSWKVKRHEIIFNHIIYQACFIQCALQTVHNVFVLFWCCLACAQIIRVNFGFCLLFWWNNEYQKWYYKNPPDHYNFLPCSFDNRNDDDDTLIDECDSAIFVFVIFWNFKFLFAIGSVNNFPILNTLMRHTLFHLDYFINWTNNLENCTLRLNRTCLIMIHRQMDATIRCNKRYVSTFYSLSFNFIIRKSDPHKEGKQAKENSTEYMFAVVFR